MSQRTATVNRLLGRVHELDPQYSANPLRLSYTKHRDALGEWLNLQQGLIAELARDELADVNRLTNAVKDLTKRISDRVHLVAPTLLTVPGCGELMAAKIVAETAGITRFKTEAAFARYAGLAPIPNSSGTTAGRSRMSRSGNRQINAALHRIAVTQLGLDGPGRVYYQRRIDTGDSPANARRCLKRQLARVVYSRLRADHHQRTQTTRDVGEVAQQHVTTVHAPLTNDRARASRVSGSEPATI